MDEKRARRLIERLRIDAGGAFVSGLAYIGYRLGVFRALAAVAPCRSNVLSGNTELHER